MTRMARRLRAGLAVVLAASIVVLSPGLEAPRLFAQVIGRAAPVSGVPTVPAFSGGAAASLPGSAPALMTAPSLTAPSAFTAAPAAAPAAVAPAAAPAALPTLSAASLPEMSKALAPSLAAAAKPATSAAGAATAGREIESIITGAKTAGTGEVSAVAGAEGSAAPALAANAAASAPSESPKSAVPSAAAPAEGKTVSSGISYRVHRLMLTAVAALTGAVNSLPAAGPSLTRKLIASAADKRVVLSDYDDTLAGYNQVLPGDMVSAIQAVKAAGKDFVVISDRGDEKRAHQLTVFESLASLPVETRAGMYLAANSGGRVYRYDEKGEPVRVFEAPALDEASKAKVAEAAEATKARLKEIGAEQHFPSETNNNPSESWGTYGYAMMLKVGSSNDAVKGAAALLQEELAKRGLDVEVNPRFAKDPANPPYINFSVVTKETSAAYIAKALKAEPKDVLIIGDSMYAPRDAKKSSWLARLGEKLSGRAMPRTGNRTDANMEKALPGALTLSVGLTGDPRASNLWVLDGKGPSVTREVLMSVASKTRAQSRPDDGSAAMIVPVVAALALMAAAAAGFYYMIDALAQVFTMGEHMLMQHGRDAMEGGMMFGGVLAGARALPLGARDAAVNPAESYAVALKKAQEIALARGADAGQVRFVEATVSLPVRSDSHWKFTFEIPGKNGGSALVFVDFSRFLGGALETRVSVYEGAKAPEGKVIAPLTTGSVAMGSKLDPQAALTLARAAQPGMSAGVSAIFDYRSEPVSGDKDLWYRFYDDKGAAVSVNARTGEARVDQALPEKSASEGAPFWKRALAGVGLFGLTAAIYGGLYYAASHAPAAVSSVPTAPGGWEMLFGGTLGALGLRGAKKADAKARTLKDSISPASPVEGFSTFVYDAGLEAARGLAASRGYAPDNLRLTGAKLSPRAWGEDWTFSFVSPRESKFGEGPRAFSVKVRRTMVSETMVDAYDAKDLGPMRLFTGFPSGLVSEAVKVSPMDAVAKTGDDARALELQARWSKAGPAELVWVVRGEKGKELKSINASTGAEAVPDPWAKFKAAAITVGLLAATAVLYGGLYYAFSHAPAAAPAFQIPQGYQGPLPNNIDIGSFFGGTLGLLGMSGVIKRAARKPKLSEERIRGAASSVASYKGRPWSHTEYNMAYYNTLESLKKDGATKAQIALFEKLCAEAPIRGGSFNPWSGD